MFYRLLSVQLHQTTRGANAHTYYPHQFSCITGQWPHPELAEHAPGQDLAPGTSVHAAPSIARVHDEKKYCIAVAQNISLN